MVKYWTYVSGFSVVGFATALTLTETLTKKQRNPSSNKLLVNNAIMGCLHLAAAASMYYLVPTPKVNSIVGINIGELEATFKKLEG